MKNEDDAYSVHVHVILRKVIAKYHSIYMEYSSGADLEPEHGDKDKDKADGETPGSSRVLVRRCVPWR